MSRKHRPPTPVLITAALGIIISILILSVTRQGDEIRRLLFVVAFVVAVILLLIIGWAAVTDVADDARANRERDRLEADATNERVEMNFAKLQAVIEQQRVLLATHIVACDMDRAGEAFGDALETLAAHKRKGR